MKKQFDRYAQYWCSDKKELEHVTVALYFLVTNSDQMLEHFLSFQKCLDWSNKLLLHSAMDGPNIKKSFEKKLNKNFQENNVKFLNIESFSLRKVHNAF